MQFSLNAPKKQSGFTLVELIMVLVIMVIVSSFALPKMNDLSSSAELKTVKAAAGVVLSAANVVYQQALLAGQTGEIGELVVDGGTIPLVYGYPANLDAMDRWVDVSGFAAFKGTYSDGAVGYAIGLRSSWVDNNNKMVDEGDSGCFANYVPATVNRAPYSDLIRCI